MAKEIKAEGISSEKVQVGTICTMNVRAEIAKPQNIKTRTMKRRQEKKVIDCHADAACRYVQTLGRRMTQFLDIASCFTSPKDASYRMFLEDKEGSQLCIIAGSCSSVWRALVR